MNSLSNLLNTTAATNAASALDKFKAGLPLSAREARMAAADWCSNEVMAIDAPDEVGYGWKSLVYEPGYNYAILHGGVSSLSLDNLREWIASTADADTRFLKVNSPGGNAIAGVAIQNELRDAGNVTVVADGVVYSAASLLMQGANERIMLTGAVQGIHKAWLFTMGNADEMRAEADRLDAVDSAILDIYAARSTLDRDAIADLLTRDTMMNASDAVRDGFADEAPSESPLAGMRLPGAQTRNVDSFAAPAAQASKPLLVGDDLDSY